MSNIDWSATNVKELVDTDWTGEKPETLPVTLNLGYVSGADRKRVSYRDAILAELARLHRIANVGESPDIDARIDELLCILEDVEGDE